MDSVVIKFDAVQPILIIPEGEGKNIVLRVLIYEPLNVGRANVRIYSWEVEA